VQEVKGLGFDIEGQNVKVEGLKTEVRTPPLTLSAEPTLAKVLLSQAD